MGDETNEEAAGGPSHQVERTVSAAEEQLERRDITFSYMSELRQSLAKKVQEEIQAKDYQSRDIMKYYGWRSIAREGRLGELVKLRKLLTEPGAQVNSTDEEGNTALHQAVLSACQYDYAFDHFYQCINVLMSSTQVKMNIPNTKGYTAIGLAVHHLNKTCVERMLKHPSAHRLYLDYYPGDSEHTVREIIKQTYPELQSLLREPVTESLDSSERSVKLLSALKRNEIKIFHENLDIGDPNPRYAEPYHCTLLEIACQMKNRERFVTLLLDSGADPNTANRLTGFPLLHATARSGNFELLEVLLKKNKIDASVKDIEERTILHWWARVSERKPGDKHILENCFNLLLHKYSVTKMDIDFRDISGNTALYIAVESGFRDRAVLLLNKGADIIVFEQVSPMLSKASKSMLEGILDDCLESNDEPVTSQKCELTYKHQLLEKMLPRMAEGPQLKDLLRHPVAATFLRLKWQHIRKPYFFNVAFYAIFLLILTAYILFSENTNKPTNGYFANNTNAPLSFNDRNTIVKYTISDNSSLWLWICLMISLVALTIREIFQIYLYGRTYILSLENWLEILLIIATFVSCSTLVENMEIKLHFSVVAIVLGWVELVLLSGRMPLLSIQLEMLKTVTLTFLRYMTGYVLLLVAFALGFYILFKGSVDLDGTNLFPNLLLSLLKTMVMFAGEFEASNLSFENLPYTSHLIFLLFVVLVSIILLNLLNGLAVGDTEKIRENAETLSLVARVQLISKIETVLYALPSSMVPTKLRSIVLYPNLEKSTEPTAIRSLLRIITNRRRASKKSKSVVSQENWSLLTEKLSMLEKQLHLNTQETHKVLKQILAHLERENRGQI
jgi:ankyrin repeat protein